MPAVQPVAQEASVERPSPWSWQQAAFASLGALRDQLPHALLLHGARGIGKRHLATCFAQSVLCESRQADGQACGRCVACALLLAGNHPDLRELVPDADQSSNAEQGEAGDAPVDLPAGRRGKPSREIRIDQVRDLADFLTMTTHRGGFRVVQLAPAEGLNAAAANALLKMLEEPPPATLFLLVSDELDAVVPTIRSRCVLVPVPGPSREQALAWLKLAGIEEAERRLAEAGGAPLLAAASANEDDARELGSALRQTLLELLGRGGTLNGADIAGAVPKDVAVGAAILLFQRWGWDLLGERTAQRVRYYPSERRVLTTLARAAEPARLIGWLDQLTDAQALSDHPLNGRLAVENALIAYMNVMRPAA